MSGYLSTKTDVFSFGMLVLEIVSGRKNIDRHLDAEKVDLLNYVSISHYQFCLAYLHLCLKKNSTLFRH
jgi:hypothetical protein